MKQSRKKHSPAFKAKVVRAREKLKERQFYRRIELFAANHTTDSLIGAVSVCILILVVGLYLNSNCSSSLQKTQARVVPTRIATPVPAVTPIQRHSTHIPKSKPTISPQAAAQINALISASTHSPKSSSDAQSIAKRMASSTNSGWSEAEEIEGFEFVLQELIMICPEVTSATAASNRYTSLYRQLGDYLADWENLLSVSESVHYILKRGYRANGSKVLTHGYCADTFEAYFGARAKWGLSESETEDLLIPLIENDFR